jgi:2-methylcitrate dehydratase PrpD
LSETRELATFTTELRFSDLPGEVVDKASELAMHSWGVQLAASTLPWSRAVYEYVQSEGGTPQSTVVNYGTRTSCGAAAMVNGVFAHGFEMDDNHARTSLKGGSVVVPTALAVGETQASSGEEFITGLVAGYEIMARLGLTIGDEVRRREHHMTGSYGALGAAATTARLRATSTDVTVHALGLAGSQLVGYQDAPPTGRGSAKRLYPGLAAMAGIRSVMLAEAGITGSGRTLDHGEGVLRAFGVQDPTSLTNGLGTHWEILDAHYKPYAQDGYIQPMTEALAWIRKNHAFDPQDIESIWIGTNSRAANEVIGKIKYPSSVTDAQFSGSFSVALFLIKGSAGFEAYSRESLTDPRVLALSDRVTIEVDDEIEAEYRKTRPRAAKVRITMASGAVYEHFVPSLRQMTRCEVEEKFRTLASVALDDSRCDDIVAMCRGLSEIPDMSCLSALLVRGAS